MKSDAQLKTDVTDELFWDPAINATHVAVIVSENVAGQISAALKRQAARQAKHIGVSVKGAVVTLDGKVHSLAERDAAVGAAYSARGVSTVLDRLELVP